MKRSIVGPSKPTLDAAPIVGALGRIEEGVRVSRIRTLVASAFVVVLAWGGASGLGSADARTDYLVQTLRASDSFRVRAQAALSLGQLRPPTSQALEALSAALRDDHPAVRTAAATALGRLEEPDPAVMAALRAARRDSEAEVRRAVDSAIMNLQRVAASRARAGTATTASSSGSGTSESGQGTAPRGPVRYYVGVGEPGTGSADVSAELVRRARDTIVRELSAIDGVEIAPENESNSTARQVIQRRRLTGYYIDSSILAVERTSAGTRVRVSIVVGTYPGRDMRAMLQGSATAPGAPSASNERAALEAAIRGALRQLPQVLGAAGAAQARR